MEICTTSVTASLLPKAYGKVSVKQNKLNKHKSINTIYTHEKHKPSLHFTTYVELIFQCFQLLKDVKNTLVLKLKHVIETFNFIIETC